MIDLSKTVSLPLLTLYKLAKVVKMNFNVDEMVDMIWILGECNKNALLSARMYHERFPERRQPTTTSFERLKDRFNRTGSVIYEKHERTKNTVTEENELNVLLAVSENPHTSIRSISKEQELTYYSVQRILAKNRMHPYHIQLHQELTHDDFEKRIVFCEWALDKINQHRDFFDYVLFGDEATFHKNGSVNRHNFHYYATTNPYHIVTQSQTRWSLNVWGGIVGNHVVGPYFFEDNLNGEMYLDFLVNRLPILLEDVPLRIRQQMWFLHDGAPVHHNALVQGELDDQFPDRWIGRNGPVQWPPRSPEFNKMDSFFWGYVKNEVYKIPPTTRDDMKDRIRNVFRSVSVQMLRNVSDSFNDRFQACINVLGGHFEHLM